MPQPNHRLDWSHPIAYAEGRDNYTILHYPDGRIELMAYTLSDVTERMNLLRIHKQVAVNPASVTKVLPHTSRHMILFIGAKRFDVARRRVSAVQNQLTSKGQ